MSNCSNPHCKCVNCTCGDNCTCTEDTCNCPNVEDKSEENENK